MRYSSIQAGSETTPSPPSGRSEPTMSSSSPSSPGLEGPDHGRADAHHVPRTQGCTSSSSRTLPEPLEDDVDLLLLAVAVGRAGADSGPVAEVADAQVLGVDVAAGEAAFHSGGPSFHHILEVHQVRDREARARPLVLLLSFGVTGGSSFKRTPPALGGVSALCQRRDYVVEWPQDFRSPQAGSLLTHFIVSADVERSLGFYRDVLGGEVVREGEPCDRGAGERLDHHQRRWRPDRGQARGDARTAALTPTS